MTDMLRRDEQLVLLPQVRDMERKRAVERAHERHTSGKRAEKIHYEPTELDYEILKYVMEYYLLTTWQLVKLHYSQGSKTRANTKLQILSGNSKDTPSEPYLYRDALHKKTAGNPTYLYFLATDGINYLQKNGFPKLTRRFRPSETQEISYLHKIHALNVNDVLIAARMLSTVAPDISLASWLHDFDMQKTPAYVAFDRRIQGGGMSTERVKIVPDGMLDFRMTLHQAAGKERRRIILPEVDRGTETTIEEFKKKILAYVHYSLPDGAFEAQFGKVNKRVAYLVTKGGENRLTTLRKWCEEILSDNDLENEYNLFRFTLVNQVVEQDMKTGKEKRLEALAIDPKTLFLSPVWYKPFHEAPDTLLWKP